MRRRDITSGHPLAVHGWLRRVERRARRNQRSRGAVAFLLSVLVALGLAALLAAVTR